MPEQPDQPATPTTLEYANARRRPGESVKAAIVFVVCYAIAHTLFILVCGFCADAWEFETSLRARIAEWLMLVAMFPIHSVLPASQHTGLGLLATFVLNTIGWGVVWYFLVVAIRRRLWRSRAPVYVEC